MKHMNMALGLTMLFSSFNALAIYKGNPVLKNDLVEKATFQLVVTNPKIPTLKLPSCSATLIGKNILLTAAHCFNYNESVVYKVSYRNSKGLKVEVPVVQHTLHPQYSTVRVENRGDVAQHDIALIKIESAIPGSIPARLPSKSWRPSEKQTVLVAGYGLNGHTRTAEEIKESPEGQALIEKWKAHPPKTEQEMIDALATLMSLAEVKPLLWTRSYAALEQDKYLELPTMTLSSGDSICSGDSGGPSYIRSSSSGLIVVGVHSTSNNADCQPSRRFWWSKSLAEGNDTVVSFYVDWIYTAAAALAK